MKFTNLTKYVISSTKDAQFKGARQLEEVSESIMKFINEKLDEFKVDQKQKGKEIAKLKEDLTSLKKSLSKLTKP